MVQWPSCLALVCRWLNFWRVTFRYFQCRQCTSFLDPSCAWGLSRSRDIQNCFQKRSYSRLPSQLVKRPTKLPPEFFFLLKNRRTRLEYRVKSIQSIFSPTLGAPHWALVVGWPHGGIDDDQCLYFPVTMHMNTDPFSLTWWGPDALQTSSIPLSHLLFSCRCFQFLLGCSSAEYCLLVRAPESRKIKFSLSFINNCKQFYLVESNGRCFRVYSVNEILKCHPV